MARPRDRFLSLRAGSVRTTDAGDAVFGGWGKTSIRDLFSRTGRERRGHPPILLGGAEGKAGTRGVADSRPGGGRRVLWGSFIVAGSCMRFALRRIVLPSNHSQSPENKGR